VKNGKNDHSLKVKNDPNHTVQSETKKDKNGNLVTTETHTYTTTASEPFTGKAPKQPTRTLTKTKDGWIETITTYETVDAGMFPAPAAPKPNGWNLSHTGKGWNSFKKSTQPKHATEIRKELSPPVKHDFKVFKSQNTHKNPFGDVITTQVTVESGGNSTEDGEIQMDDEGRIIRGHKTKRFYRVNTHVNKDRRWKRYMP
jgi:hypothetical protein